MIAGCVQNMEIYIYDGKIIFMWLNHHSANRTAVENFYLFYLFSYSERVRLDISGEWST